MRPLAYRPTTLCPLEERDRQYFGHNFDKFKYIVIIFARDIMKVMRNH